MIGRVIEVLAKIEVPCPYCGGPAIVTGMAQVSARGSVHTTASVDPSLARCQTCQQEARKREIEALKKKQQQMAWSKKRPIEARP